MAKEKYDKIDLFENYPIPKAVSTLVVPTVLACLVMVLYNLADTFFVGMLDDPVQTSAVTLVAPVVLAFNAVVNLGGIGCSSLMSRALGSRDYETVKKTSAFGFYFSIIAGALLSLICIIAGSGMRTLLGATAVNDEATAQYMFWTVFCGAIPSITNVVTAQLVRAEGMALHASIGTMSGCLLNIVLDPVFILPWGLNMGAAGAGCATFISNCVACLYFVILILIKGDRTLVSINPNDFRPTKSIIKEVCGVGIPAAIQNLLNVTGMTVLNYFTAAYGAEAVSAMGIAHKMSLVPLYISMGIGQGIMPLVGYNYAANNRKRMKDSLIFTVWIAGAFMIAATVLYFVFSRDIIGLFMKNQMVVDYGGEFLRGMSLAQFFLGIDFLAVGVFQACGMGKKSFIFAILRKIVLEIPALFILNKLFPMYGLAYAQLVAEVILSVIAVIELKKILDEPVSPNAEPVNPETLNQAATETAE
ncbi:MAG: MATE family efflux transporter [Lachnospiraceae bacterium]|nr:MATE family efflux transporter [Candidatus Darwinimomas equi]